MRHAWYAVLVVVAVAGLPAAGMTQEIGQAPRAELLRQAIEERFLFRVQRDLGLTNDETNRVARISANYSRARIGLEQEQQRIRVALQGQLRPGVAADQDSLSHLLDRLLAVRVEYTVTFQDEMKELSVVLSPVQRAQFFLIRDQIYQRAQELRDQRPAAGARRGRP